VTRWIIDGMNVIGSRPTGWWHDRPGAMQQLVHELLVLDEPVTVIFDGRAHDAGGGERVAVSFARRSGPDAADDDVAALVARHPDPASLTVVTSDAALASRVHEAGGEVVGAGAFLRRLDEAE
jgi:predicted RNA-binding protein with PIN domain